MTREGSTRDSYTGRSGQLAVLTELLARRCNVAIPEVDEGEDVLAFVLDEPDVTRIQVKTATAKRLKQKGKYAARVSVPLAQVEAEPLTPLHYVFAIRLEDRWSDFVILSRDELSDLNQFYGVGYINQKAGELQLYLSFSPTSLTCSGQDLQPYRNAWDRLPVMQRRPQGGTE